MKSTLFKSKFTELSKYILLQEKSSQKGRYLLKPKRSL